MFIFNPWIALAPVFAFIALRYARLKSSRSLVIRSGLFLAIAFAAFLWTPAHFAAVGCSGDIMSGIDCPEGTLLTKFALLHSVLMLLGRIYFYLVLPFVFLWIVWSERRHAAKQRR